MARWKRHGASGSYHRRKFRVGAGSVVTKDIPENVVAFGSPCKVYREINEHDKEYYFGDRRFDEQPERE